MFFQVLLMPGRYDILKSMRVYDINTSFNYGRMGRENTFNVFPACRKRRSKGYEVESHLRKQTDPTSSRKKVGSLTDKVVVYPVIDPSND